MFILAMVLTSVGYAVLYHGLSVSKAYKRRQIAQGGIPLPQLLGIPMPHGTTKYSAPPFPTAGSIRHTDTGGEGEVINA